MSLYWIVFIRNELNIMDILHCEYTIIMLILYQTNSYLLFNYKPIDISYVFIM